MFSFLFFNFGVKNGLSWVDTKQYVQLAHNVLEQGTFSLSTSTPYLPDTLRTPGYPLFLAAVYAVSHDFWLASVIQAVLGAFVPVFAVLLAFAIFRRRDVALLSGYLTAFEPHLNFYSLGIGTEGLFIPILCGLVYVLFKHIQQPRLSLVLSATALLVVGAYIRPALLYFIPIALVVVLVPYYVNREFKKGVIAGLCFLLLSLSCLGAWNYRNYVETGSFSFSSVGWVNAYTRTAITIDAMVSKTDFSTSYLAHLTELKDEGYLTELKEYELYNVKFNALLRERTLATIRAHPKEFVLLELLSLQAILTQDNMLWMLNHTGLVAEATRPPIPLSLTIVQQGPVQAIRDLLPYLKGSYIIPFILRPIWFLFILFAILGFGLVLKKGDREQRTLALFGATTIAYFIVVTLPVAASIDARYRVVFEPIYFSFVAAGLSLSYSRLSRLYARTFAAWA